MLVIVHHGDVTLLTEATLYLKTFGSLYILKVDAAECGRQSLDNLYEFFGVLLIYLNVKTVKSGKNLKQQRLTFHYGFSGKSAYVAKPEYGCSIGNHRHKIALARVLIGILGILFNFKAGISYARRISQCEILL